MLKQYLFYKHVQSDEVSIEQFMCILNASWIKLWN